jgi:hypothetical protein
LHIAISAWDSSVENVEKIEMQLETLNPTVINSTTSYRFRNQVTCPNIFIKQVIHALEKRLNGETLLFISGDAISNNWLNLVERIDYIFGNDGIGVYSPYITYEGYPSEKVMLSKSFSDSDLDLGVMTDGIVFALNPAIANFTHRFTLYLSENFRNTFEVGWGIDWAWCAYAILCGQAIIRDKHFPVLHPQGTSYSPVTAEEEFRKIVRLLPEFLETEGFSLAEANKVLYGMSERLRGSKKYLQWKAFYSENPLEGIL